MSTPIIEIQLQEKKMIKEGMLPGRIKLHCKKFISNPHENGFILIRNNPVEDKLGETGDIKKKGHISEDILELYASIFGEIYFLNEHHNGLKIQNIYPKKEHIGKQIGSNSDSDLFWHTEFANVTDPCRYILLYCIRGDIKVNTLIAKPDLNSIKHDVIQTLQKDLFSILPDESMNTQGKKYRGPIIRLTNHGLIDRIVFDPLYTICDNNEAKVALDQLQENIDNNYQSVTLSEGDLLVFNNHLTIHSRSYLSGRFDGTDRWLQRICTY